MTKVRPHRNKYKENTHTPSEGSTIAVIAADQLVCIQTGRNTKCDSPLYCILSKVTRKYYCIPAGNITNCNCPPKISKVIRNIIVSLVVNLTNVIDPETVKGYHKYDCIPAGKNTKCD